MHQPLIYGYLKLHVLSFVKVCMSDSLVLLAIQQFFGTLDGTVDVMGNHTSKSESQTNFCNDHDRNYG